MALPASGEIGLEEIADAQYGPSDWTDCSLGTISDLVVSDNWALKPNFVGGEPDAMSEFYGAAKK